MVVLLSINVFWAKYGESIMGILLMKENKMWIKFNS